MLHIASSSQQAIGTPLGIEGSVFAPTPSLLQARESGHLSPTQFERQYTAHLRLSFQEHRQFWTDLAEQAGTSDLTLIGDPQVVQVLFGCLVAVGAQRGLVLDPGEDDLNAAAIESRRSKVLAAHGITPPAEFDVLRQAASSPRKARYR